MISFLGLVNDEDGSSAIYNDGAERKSSEVI